MASSIRTILVTVFALAAAAIIGPAGGQNGCFCNGLTVENRGNRVVPYSGECLS